LINKRQGGRRRGRGPRGQNLGGQPGNRQDNRQRGNAAQLLEKYKNMARDAQLAGDRVQSEYYLQFADHYFRVLGENRARVDEQRRQRGDDLNDDENDEEFVEASEDDSGDSDDRRPREAEERRPRENGRDRNRRNGGREAANSDDEDEERLSLDVLPPSIARDSIENDDEDEAPKPRRRARRPRSDDSAEDIAPAA
jgi:hypothetical protein